MSTLIVIMIMCGIGLIAFSFVIKSDDTPAVKNVNAQSIQQQNVELTDKQKEDIKAQINELIEEQIHSIDDRTEASLDKISNMKILEMNEYADTIMNEISRNHNETVFLYDMLNEKAKEVKGTVKDVNIAKEQVKKIKMDTVSENTKETVNDEFSEEKDDRQKAKMRLKELIKQNENDDFDNAVKVRQSSQAGNLSDLVEQGKNNLQSVSLEKEAVENESKVTQRINNPRNEKILELYNAGFEQREIAQKLSLGIGEVKLVIDLYNRK